MAIKPAPTPTDMQRKGKKVCSRWRVIIYNSRTGRHDWYTVLGTKRDAEEFERDHKTKVARNAYIPKATRKTFAEVADLFLAERRNRDRRTATLACYETIFRRHLMPKDDNGVAGEFAPCEIGRITLVDIEEFFQRMRARGASTSTVNRVLRAFKAVLFFAAQRRLVETNPLQYFKPYDRKDDGRRVKRDAFTTDEIAAIRAVAKGRERVFFDFLVSTGIRPGELYALDWSCVDLDAGLVRIERNWDHRGKKFVPPKTTSGRRVVHLAAPLIADLREYRKATGGTGLVLATREGNPMNPSNVRRDIWHPLLERAQVRMLDAYSLRHTFATLARGAGLFAFDVAHAMGHSKCSLVDQVYAHASQPGLASVGEAVGAQVFSARPRLRAIEGGRDVATPLDGEASTEDQKSVSA